MKRYYEFKEYLESGWAASTIHSYSSAIHIISNELISYGFIECNIYMIDNTDTINSLLEQYLKVPELKKKDEKGRTRYSNAIKRYVEFYNSAKHSRSVNIDNKIYSISNDDKPKTKSDLIETNIIEKVKRDSSISGNVIERASYLCEYNKSHKHFISNTTKENYVEAHHIIPMNAHNDFKNSLDVEANISSLCVVCHKTIHHGRFEDKVNIIKRLYNDRKERLKSCDIHIKYLDLLNYYK